MSNSTLSPPAPLVRRFARNTRGRDLVVGDVHGCFTKLDAALQAVRFDPAAGDRLFMLGDLVDRGPESGRVLEWLARPGVFALRGNHDDMAIRWPRGNMDVEDYLRNGGGWNIVNPPELQLAISRALEALPLAIELETETGLVGLVHADCPLGSWPAFVAALEDPETPRGRIKALAGTCMWARDRADHQDESLVDGVRAVLVGHTPVDRVTSLGNTLYLDTGGWMQGGASSRAFTILDAATLAAAFGSTLTWPGSD